jgi:hypothetical protein
MYSSPAMASQGYHDSGPSTPDDAGKPAVGGKRKKLPDEEPSLESAVGALRKKPRNRVRSVAPPLLLSIRPQRSIVASLAVNVIDESKRCDLPSSRVPISDLISIHLSATAKFLVAMYAPS